MDKASWKIEPYDWSMKDEWDEFVAGSRNSTFLFMRDYMDYHSHIFADNSLMGYRNGSLAAVLPANVFNGVLYSHQGLTYGGWVLPSRGPDVGDLHGLWICWMKYCVLNKLATIVYKPLPFIYASRPAQEDLYLLFLCNSRIIRTDISTAIDLTCNPGFNKLQKRHLKKNSGKCRIEIIDWSDEKRIDEFHRLLTICLMERHTALPVHSDKELKYLMTRFPDHIRIWGVLKEESDELLAGVAVYITENCVHCQYIATTVEGRKEDFLAPLFNEMITFYTDEGYRYFDFGTSNENNGRLLNTGLNRQKTSYGGTGVAYQQFEINVPSALGLLENELWRPR